MKKCIQRTLIMGKQGLAVSATKSMSSSFFVMSITAVTSMRCAHAATITWYTLYARDPLSGNKGVAATAITCFSIRNWRSVSP
jgi:hypothetical protein